MKYRLLACLLIVSNCILMSNPMKLWYDKPASVWVEALPLGNGRLGAMVYRNPQLEEIQLNEETFWGGSPYNNVNPLAKDSLAKIRQLIFEDRNVEAQAIAGNAISSQGANGMPYQTIGSLKFNFGTNSFTDFYRDLNLEDATATTTYTSDGIKFKREVFTSFTDQLVIVRLTSSGKNAISFDARLTTPIEEAKSAKSIYEGMLRLSEISSDHEGIIGKVEATTLVKIVMRADNKRFYLTVF